MIPRESIKQETSVPITMRDGIKLFADIYRPDTNARYPAILTRTGNREMVGAREDSYMDSQRIAQAGYVVIIQDTRGSGGSEGELDLRLPT